MKQIHEPFSVQCIKSLAFFNTLAEPVFQTNIVEILLEVDTIVKIIRYSKSVAYIRDWSSWTCDFRKSVCCRTCILRSSMWFVRSSNWSLSYPNVKPIEMINTRLTGTTERRFMMPQERLSAMSDRGRLN